MVCFFISVNSTFNLHYMSSKLPAILFILIAFTALPCCAQKKTKPVIKQDMAVSAAAFLASLSDEQKAKAQFAFSDEERYNWHFIPKERKGIRVGDLNESQLKLAMALLKISLSDTGYAKAAAIIQLENVLREVENRPASDMHRSPANYCFSVFGKPGTDSIWGWRLEGHHISLNFSSENNQLVSATPGFLGSNPAIVLAGPEKGKQILKDETDLGLALVKSLDEAQLAKAMMSKEAPADIITSASRKAMIENPQGIFYNELNADQQKRMMQLLSLYIHRYTKLFAKTMMDEITAADINKLQFAWAGELQSGPGHPHYYRIQGPTIIIEYDNTQNNANHVHSVLRDLKHDFGGDELLEHYKSSAHN